MDIKTALLKEHSKQNTLCIAQNIGQNAQGFDTLMELVLYGETTKICQRAAWVMTHCIDNNPKLLSPYYLKKMVERLNQQNELLHDAVKRNIIRQFQFIDIPENLLGLLANICFDYINDPNEAIAVRAFSLQVFYNISLKVPELQNELKLLINENMPHATAAFVSRGRKILKKLP